MSSEPQRERKSRASILRAVQKPLHFFALLVLVIEGILVYLASKASGLDLTLLVAGMIVVLLTVVFMVGRPPGWQVGDDFRTEETPIKHDVFVSSPMAALDSEEEYAQTRADALKILEALRRECHFESVVYSGREIQKMADFEAPDLSAVDDIQGLKGSRLFLLHYPRKVASSVLFEAGVALALRKPSVFFVTDRGDLPFLMQNAEQAFPGLVRIYECGSADKIVALVARHREELFPAPKGA